jgi:hypothetical protein
VKPNPYFEALAWCKRNNISFQKCKTNYIKEDAVKEACNRYEEKLHYVKPEKKCPEGKEINPKTGRCIKIKIKKEPKLKREKNIKKEKRPVQKSANKLSSPNADSIRSNASLGSMKSLSDFSVPKSLSRSIQKNKSNTKKNSRSQYSRVFFRQKIEKKNAKYFKNLNHDFSLKKSKDPMEKTVLKENIDLKNLKKLKIKKIRRQPFINDFFDDKNVKKSLKSQAEQSLKNSLSSRSRKVKYMLEKVKANRIQRFFKKNLLKKYFTLEKRVKYYNYVVQFLKNLNELACLGEKQFKTKDNEVINGYTVHDVVDLEKRIGTDSAFGVIYRTSVKNMLGRAPIATKLMEIDINNTKEADINMNLSKNILHKQLSRHFLFCYKLFVCSKPSWLVPRIISNTRYLITLNELAHGDLKNLCSDMNFLKNNDLVINIAIQCILSIASFHKVGYIHQDCHWGNFLYHLTDDKSGYYHYKINDEDFYLKNCGYTMMIYDFGLCSKYKKVDNSTLKLFSADYIRILQAFKNKTMRGWCESYQYPVVKISSYINELQDTIIAGVRKSTDENDLLKNVILTKLLRVPTNGIFLRNLPLGETIVNNMPYIIDDRFIKT